MKYAYKILVGNSEWKKPPVSFKYKVKGNINMNDNKYGELLW
jgi:hypothetical protein